jgi:hypothetical protein
MNLGKIIAALRDEDPNLVMPVGFNEPHSWRGQYHELAFEPARYIKVGAVLHAAESANGATFEGYNGGNYTMNEYSDCWLSTYGRGAGESIGPIMLKLMLAVAKAGIEIEED